MRQFSSAAPKAIRLLAGTWTLGFLLMLALGAPATSLVMAMNVFEIAFGLLAGGVLLALCLRQALPVTRYAMLGTALAVFSWTLGQVFWYSYTSLTGEALPYPSVGDLGYTGTYFFLAGVLRLLSGERKEKHPWYSWLSFMVLTVPAALAVLGEYTGAAYIYNFVLALAISVTFLQGFSILGERQYRRFVVGVFVMGVADLIFMLSVCLYPESHLYLSDVMYCLALALITSGMLERGVADG